MNGAPRIAPTPTSSVASPPPPKTMAMIGIIVSGSAVPTAARTDPTAPWASSSLRPNHSIPLVNSSAPSEDDDERDREDERGPCQPSSAMASDDRDQDDDEDGERDRGQAPVARGEEAEARHDDPPDRQRDDEHDPRPQEALGLEARGSGRGIAVSSNGGNAPWSSGSMPSASIRSTPTSTSPIAEPRADHEEPGDDRLDRVGGVARASARDAVTGPAPGAPSGTPCTGARRRTASAGSARRCGARPASRRRADEHAERDRPGDVRVDLVAQQVDHRGRDGRDADHHVARRGRRPGAGRPSRGSSPAP